MTMETELRERLCRRFRTRSYIASPEQAADDALEVFGLDDLDAVVERGAWAMVTYGPRESVVSDLDCEIVKAVLKAAFTPPEYV
jgi:hypothetical protein